MLKSFDRIKAWIQHLVLNCLEDRGSPNSTIFLSRDKLVIFSPVEQGSIVLADLLLSYWYGLYHPLPFFPESSLSYARALFKEYPEERALRSAEVKWMGGYAQPGDGDDPYNRQVFGMNPPLDEEFQNLARRLLLPMLQHTESENKI